MSERGKLAYWPEAYEDELIYSMVARYARHTGIRSASVLSRELFDGDNHRPTFDLPNGMERLAGRLPKGAGLTASRLIRRHTLYPYYRAVGSLDRARGILRSMMVDENRVEKTRQLSLRIPRTTVLRFCPACDHEALYLHGELYWRRVLQLPGVLVCPAHGTILKTSSVGMNGTTGRRYVPATQTTNGPSARYVVGPLQANQATMLNALARRSAGILGRGRWDGADDQVWRRQFRDACSSKGVDTLSKDHGYKGRIELERAATDTVGFLSPLWPRLLGQASSTSWMRTVDGIGGKQRDPVLRILAELVVERMPDRPQPFGPGPWECLNPLSGHFRESTVLTVSVRRGLGGDRSMIGTFKCACGYVYTRAIGANGETRSPWLIEYGPSLKQFIEESLATGRSIHDAARITRLDSKRFKRLVAELGFGEWLEQRGRKTRRDREGRGEESTSRNPSRSP